MRTFLLTLGMATSGLMAAQQTTHKASPEGTGCPVGFNAEVSARAVMHTAAEDKEFGGGPTVELTFVPHEQTQVVNASVIVHGFTPSGRVFLVKSTEDGSASETFDLTAMDGLSQQELRVSKLAVVRWVDLTEIKYADGTTWRARAGETCRAVPGLFRPVKAVARPAGR